MDDHEAFRRQVRKTMFENGIPVGSDDPKLNLLGSPPLHLCDPDVVCDLCGRYPKGINRSDEAERAQPQGPGTSEP